MNGHAIARRTLDSVHVRRQRRKNVIEVLGDSHANVFNVYPFPDLAHAAFHVESVAGATVSGLQNPNSATQAGPTFAKRLEMIKAERRAPIAIIVSLGEVDAGFVIWWHHQNGKAEVRESLERLIGNLDTFTSQCAELAPVIILSPPLPTVVNCKDYGEMALHRRDVRASFEERLDLTLEIVDRYRKICSDRGHSFIDTTDEAWDGRRISPLLVNRDPNDFHYDPMTYGRLLERKMLDLDLFQRIGHGS